MMNNETELKPCPFCAGTDVEFFRCDPGCCGAEPRSAVCLNCGCELPMPAAHGSDQDMANHWNARPTDNTAAMREALEKSKDLFEMFAAWGPEILLNHKELSRHHAKTLRKVLSEADQLKKNGNNFNE